MNPRLLDMQIYAYIHEHPNCKLSEIADRIAELNPDVRGNDPSGIHSWRSLCNRHLKSMARYGIIISEGMRPRLWRVNDE